MSKGIDGMTEVGMALDGLIAAVHQELVFDHIAAGLK